MRIWTLLLIVMMTPLIILLIKRILHSMIWEIYIVPEEMLKEHGTEELTDDGTYEVEEVDTEVSQARIH